MPWLMSCMRSQEILNFTRILQFSVVLRNFPQVCSPWLTSLLGFRAKTESCPALRWILRGKSLKTWRLSPPLSVYFCFVLFSCISSIFRRPHTSDFLPTGLSCQFSAKAWELMLLEPCSVGDTKITPAILGTSSMVIRRKLRGLCGSKNPTKMGEHQTCALPPVLSPSPASPSLNMIFSLDNYHILLVIKFILTQVRISKHSINDLSLKIHFNSNEWAGRKEGVCRNAR